MSMLAERKRKQKWSLNPRGKEWSQDANKFGQKMLEKMGWQSGRGLGLKENGITEHIKVSIKNDSKGMGYKEMNDQWTEHETNFSALLESLSGEKNNQDDLKVTSLEKKSQTSRARVHYHKFTRGKDLSRYSEKDLANIFGRKSLQNSIEINKETDVVSKDGENASDLLVNGGSMMDYFKNKLTNSRKLNGYLIGKNGVLRKQESESESDITSFGFGFKADNTDYKHSDSESEVRPSFGFGCKSNDSKLYTENSELEHDGEKRNNKPSFVSYVSDNPCNKRPAVEIELSVLSPKKKAKKSKLKTEEMNGIANPAFNPMSTPIKIEKHTLNTIEECTNEDVDESMSDSLELHESHKKMKNEQDTEESRLAEENGYEVSTNKSKKKKKSKTKEITETDHIEEKTSKVKKMKDKHLSMNQFQKVEKKIQNSVDNPTFDDTEDVSSNVCEIRENPFEVPCKKSKKNKNKTEVVQSIDNPSFDIIDTFSNLQEVEENPYEVKIKKNKKSKKIEVVNPNFDHTEDTSIDLSEIYENSYEVSLSEKKKKREKKAVLDNPSFIDHIEKPIDSINPYEVKPKKKKRKGEESGIANPALNLSNTNSEEKTVVEDCDLMLNIVSTPVQKEQHMTCSANISESVKRRKSVRFSNLTQELIIPNNDDIKEMYGKKNKSKKKKNCLDNINFDKYETNLDENIDIISKTLDNYQAEIENDINDDKMNTVNVEDFMVGEVGNPEGENELVKDGTKLKFKYANMDTHTPFYMKDSVGAKKSYKHLIKGDILLKFQNTNLHEIKGYGVKKANIV